MAAVTVELRAVAELAGDDDLDGWCHQKAPPEGRMKFCHHFQKPTRQLPEAAFQEYEQCRLAHHRQSGEQLLEA